MIAGMITQVVRKQTKNGDLWAIVTVEDLEAAIEVAAASRKVYATVALQLASDTVVRIKDGCGRRTTHWQMTGQDVTFPMFSDGPSGPLLIQLPAVRCTPASSNSFRAGAAGATPGATECAGEARLCDQWQQDWKLDEGLRVGSFSSADGRPGRPYSGRPASPPDRRPLR